MTGLTIDYTQLDGGDFLAAVGTDAYKWAEAFMQVKATKPEDWIDRSLMLGWFANAIMAQYDADRRGVRIPTSRDEAKLMALLGTNWLKEHAPEELRCEYPAESEK